MPTCKHRSEQTIKFNIIIWKCMSRTFDVWWLDVELQSLVYGASAIALISGWTCISSWLHTYWAIGTRLTALLGERRTFLFWMMLLGWRSHSREKRDFTFPFSPSLHVWTSFPPFSRQSPLPTSSRSLWGLLLYVQHSGSSIWWFESQSHSNKLWIRVEFASSGDSYLAVGRNDRLCPVLGSSSNSTPDWISRRKCLHWWRKAVCLVKRSFTVTTDHLLVRARCSLKSSSVSLFSVTLASFFHYYPSLFFHWSMTFPGNISQLFLGHLQALQAR